MDHMTSATPTHPGLQQGCQHNVEDWQRILQVRSMVLTQQEEIKSWVKFASICRKSGKMDLSRKTLMSLLKSDQSFSEQLHPISLQYPQVSGRVVLVGGAMWDGIILTWLGAYRIIHLCWYIP